MKRKDLQDEHQATVKVSDELTRNLKEATLDKTFIEDMKKKEVETIVMEFMAYKKTISCMEMI